VDFKDKFKNIPFVQMKDLNGQLVEVPEASVADALKAGLAQFDPEDVVDVVSPAGEAGTISGTDAPSALSDGGFRLETAAEKSDREKKEYLETLPQEAAAAGLGAARGLSFGVSDVLATETGALSPEYLQAQEEINPGLSTAGEVAGVVGGLVVPVGAAGAAVKGASAVGKAAERALAKGLGKGLSSRLAAKSGGFAAEGALYGAGEAISESAIEDKPLTAEALASSVGTGALLGGAFGGAFAGAEELASLGKQIIRPIADRSRKAFSKLTSPEDAFLDIHGVNSRDRFLTETKYPDLPEKGIELLRRGHADGDFKVLSNTDDLVQYYEKVRNRAAAEIDDVSKQIENISAINPQVKTDVAAVVTNIEKRFDDVISSTKVDTDLRKTLQKFKDDFVETVLREPDNVNFKTLQEFRREADKIVYKRSKFGQDTDKADAARLFTEAMRDELDAFATRADATLPPEQRGQLFKRLKEANSDYHVASSWQQDAIKKATKKDQMFNFNDLVFGSALGSAADSLLQGVGALSLRKLADSTAAKNALVLGKLQNLQAKFDNKITKSLSNFFTGARKPIRASSISSLMNSPLSYTEGGKAPDNRRTAFKNVSAKVQKFKTNPESIVSKVVGNTTLLDRAAPGVAEGLVPVATRAINFLSDKMPQEVSPYGLFDKQFEPSDLELSQFERYMEGVEDPTSALEDIQSGTLTREKVEAIAYVYPEFYRKLQTSALEFVQEHEQLPYQKKVQLGILLDIPADSSLSPESVMNLQATFAQQQPQQAQPGGGGAPVKPNQTAVKNLSSAENKNSSTQAFMQRRNSNA